MPTITAPNPSVRQISTENGKDWALSLLVRRTYDVDPSGACSLAEPVPLTATPRYSENDANLLEADLDLIPLKPRTDVIVQGHAQAYGTAASVEVRIRVDRHLKKIAVLGDRHCTLGSGRILFSPARPFETMPLTFARAYGGRDQSAEVRHGHHFALLAPYLVGTAVDAANQSPYLYPRNPCGRGYLVEVTPAAVDLCALPNLEDPHQLLTPDSLAVGHVDRWIYMPIPQAPGWINWGWFPRTAFGGLRQEYARERAPVPEVARGLLAQAVLDCHEPGSMPLEHLLRFGNGAPLDLQLPHLRGGELVELSHVHPTVRQWRFTVPAPPARMCVDGRNGKLLETRPVLQTMVIEPDASRLTLVWRGSASAIRPYLPQELATMPLLVAP